MEIKEQSGDKRCHSRPQSRAASSQDNTSEALESDTWGGGGGGVSSLSGDKYLGKVGKPRPDDKISHLKEEGARQEKNKVRQQVNHLTDGHMTRVQRQDAENRGRVQLAALKCQIIE